VQPLTPVQNVLALYEAFRQCRDYPLVGELFAEWNGGS
jgi:hypothetical protein